MKKSPAAFVVIPARWRSGRFPGKPLAPIAGVPMIDRVWAQVARAQTISGAVIATDDQRIFDHCTAAGMDVCMTSPDHATGTDRIAEAVESIEADYVVNVQGDQPIIPPQNIDMVSRCMADAIARGIDVVTAYLPHATEEQKRNPSKVHIVPTVDGCVHTMSRLPVPYVFAEPYAHKIHVGIYGFTRDALRRFGARPRGPVEKSESIELFRFLEYGDRIACVEVQPGSVGVNNPEDIEKVEAALRSGAAS